MNKLRTVAVTIALAANTQIHAQQDNVSNSVYEICWPKVQWTTGAESYLNQGREQCIERLIQKCWIEYNASTWPEWYANEWIQACYIETAKQELKN